ncbi:MAG: nucleotide exchange factor GrpE [Bacteroidaceae bacterium]|nr:nucleotide exchange factor GrpE [Bacteroidaceae bacterium]
MNKNNKTFMAVENINKEEMKEDVSAKGMETSETVDNAADNIADKDNEVSADVNAENQQEEKEEKKEPTLEEQVAELNDKYLRKLAEFENYRKRTMKEKAELILNGAARTVEAFLPVVDDMERALENASKTEDIEAIREGMKMIFQKFEKSLTSLGVKKIDTTDADFNTDFHEAIAMVSGMGEDKKNKVIDCIQTGYMLNDKVIRHAKVAVGQ